MSRSYFSTIFDHDVDIVWAVARDFNGLATWWSEAVSESHIEEGKSGDQVGAVRSFRFGDTTFRERLLAMSDVERSFSYEFSGPAPFPVSDYLSTFRVTPVADGRSRRSFVEWWVTFDCKEAERDHWTKFFASEVYAPALKALADHLSRSR